MNFNQIINKIISTTYSTSLNWNANKLMAFLMFIGLSLGAVLNFIVVFIYRGNDLNRVLLLSICLIALGFASILLVNLKLKENITTHLLGMIGFIVIPLIVVQFAGIGGGSVWAVCLIFMTGSLIFTNRTLFIYISLSAILTQIIVWMSVPEISVVVSAPSYITRIGLIVIAIFVGYVVNKMYLNKIAENLAHIKTIELLAYNDHLTGLPNRLLFAERLEQAILDAKDSGKILAVLFLDLDDFKTINDTMGHDVGDQLLIDLSGRLLDVIPKDNTVARFGGDEFTILVKDLTVPDDSKSIAGNILNVIKKPFTLNDHDIFITASIGIALYPIDGENQEILIKYADLAMYKAKAKGKNQYEICTPHMRTIMVERDALLISSAF